MKTKQIKPGEELVRKLEFFQCILDNIPAHVLVLNHKAKVVMTNKRWIDFADKYNLEAVDDWVGQDYRTIILQLTGASKEGTKSIETAIKDILTGRKPEFDYSFSTPQFGTTKWFRFQGHGFSFATNNWISITHQEISGHNKSAITQWQSEERYRSLSQATFEAIFFSENGVCIEQNQTAEKIFGYTLAEATGRKDFEWFVPNDRETVMDHLLSGCEDPFEATAIRKDGTTFFAEVRARMTHYKGRAIRITAMSDISKQKQAENALRESEKKYRSLFTSANDAIFLMKNGRFITCNPKTLVMFGCEENEIIGHSPRAFSPEYQADGISSLEKATEKIKATLSGKPQFFEWIHHQKNGSQFNAEVSLNKIMLSDGEYIHAIVRDITKRKQAEEALRISEEKLRTITENTSDYIMLVGLDMKILFINKTTADLKKEEVLGMCISDFTPKEYRKFVKDNFKKVIESGKPLSYQTKYTAKTSEVQYFDVRLSPVISKGKTIAVVSSSNNVTERYLAEQERHESELRFKTMIEHASDALYIQDFNGRIIEVNDKACKSLGYTRTELLSMTVNDIDIDYNTTNFRKIMWKLRQGQNVTIESVLKKKNGTTYPTEISLGIITIKNQNVIIGFARDITDRKQAEEALIKSEQQYRDFFEKDISGSYLSSPKGKLVSCNAAFAKMLGYNATEILEMEPSLLYPYPNQRDNFISHLTKNKTIIDAEIDLVRKDGQIINCIENVIGIFNPKGELVQFQGYIMDITERKKAEEDLIKRNKELQIFYDAAVGRELKVVELKKEINNMLASSGKNPKYKIPV